VGGQPAWYRVPISLATFAVADGNHEFADLTNQGCRRGE
jgi:hypothetical protein